MLGSSANGGGASWEREAEVACVPHSSLGDAIFTTISSKHHGLTHAFPTQIPLDRIRSVLHFTSLHFVIVMFRDASQPWEHQMLHKNYRAASGGFLD